MTALLTLTRWLSPGYPLGAFAYSHGLEAAVAAGEVTDAATLERWVADVLTHGSGQADAVLLAHVLAGGDADAAADLCAALAASAERWEEARDMGVALSRTLAASGEADVPPHPLPVALGLAARPLALPAPAVLALYLQSFAANLVACAQRAVPLGQAAAQGVLARLAPLIERAAAAAAHGDPARIGTCALGADMAAMRHETMQPRMFRT